MKLVEEEWLAGHIDHALGLGSGDVSEAGGKPAGQDDDREERVVRSHWLIMFLKSGLIG
jgi:hypothetical protein